MLQKKKFWTCNGRSIKFLLLSTIKMKLKLIVFLFQDQTDTLINVAEMKKSEISLALFAAKFRKG